MKEWNSVYLGKVAHTRADSWAQLQVPQVLGSSLTTWARPMGFSTGGPAVGTIVLVQFIAGDLNFPIYSTTSQKVV
jgi:hypothetical protein